MKRVKCPKCGHYITFDETQYQAGQSLVFVCDACQKQFGIRLGTASVQNTRRDEDLEAEARQADCGSLVVVENVFHYKQVLPLQMGDNVIGRHVPGSSINTPIETRDPSIDTTHCILTVSRDKRGNLRYLLRDAPSNTGTFYMNEILADRDRVPVEEGGIITIGATTMILRTPESEEE